ncbi:MAG TPA: hypothetical protein VJ765_17035 [Chitinophagaceae bacterium]|nr:hypothetical protein [Chitinophagaceae bacterium]
MKKLSPRIHGILDYFTVLFLVISPSLFEMENNGSAFAYLLAITHLILTLFTNFQAGVFKIIPLRIHGLIELIVSIALVAIAMWFRNLGDTVSFYYYLVFSVALIIIWLASEYRPVPRTINGKYL